MTAPSATFGSEDTDSLSASHTALTGFSPTYATRYAKISRDLTTLENGELTTAGGRRTRNNFETIAVGNGPVPSWPEGRYFCVHILYTNIDPLAPEKLAVGVTAEAPGDMIPPVRTADALPGSTVLAGFDGHIYENQRQFNSNWNSRSLKAGDKIGVLLSWSSDFVIFVNGVHILTRAVDDSLREAQVFPVVDLLGSATGVTLLTEAPPPSATRKFLRVERMWREPQAAYLQPIAAQELRRVAQLEREAGARGEVLHGDETTSVLRVDGGFQLFAQLDHCAPRAVFDLLRSPHLRGRWDPFVQGLRVLSSDALTECEVVQVTLAGSRESLVCWRRVDVSQQDVGECGGGTACRLGVAAGRLRPSKAPPETRELLPLRQPLPLTEAAARRDRLRRSVPAVF